MERYIPNVKHNIFMGVVTLIGIVLSLGAFDFVKNNELKSARSEFNLLAQERVIAVERRVESELTVLRSIVALFNSAEAVNRDDFKNLFKTLETSEIIEALEWIPLVNQVDRSAYEQQAREDGFGQFRFLEKSGEGNLVTAQKREFYFPVYYVEPYQGNEGAMGFDLGSNPTRLAAIEQARDEGRMIASGRINLVQLKGDNAGVLVFVPVYRQDRTNKTVKQRRENLSGLILGVFRISKLVSGFTAKSRRPSLAQTAGIDLYLYDEEQSPAEQLIYVHQSRARQEQGVAAAPLLELNKAVSSINLKHSFIFGGRKWSIVAKPIDPDFANKITLQPWLILLTGLLITVLIVFYMFSNLRRSEEINYIVERRTAELDKATQLAWDGQARVDAILDTVIDAIITIDEVGTVETYNPAAEKIFGYSADEVIGKNVNCLMPNPYREEHDAYLRRYHQTDEPHVIGIGREVVGRRKDGSTFPMDLSVSKMLVRGSKMYTGIVRDITERKKSEESLVLAKEQAERNNRMKSEFLNMMSHELRTPLTVIIGYLPLLVDEENLPEPAMVSGIAKEMDRAGNHLLHLINDLLDLSKIEAGQMILKVDSFSTTELVQTVLDSLQIKVADKQVLLVNESHDQNLFADMIRLKQILINLVGNAIKFTEQGSITVATRKLENGVEFSVTDTGIGMPAEDLPHIFDKFRQIDSSSTRAAGGTGLGLAITQKLVQLHKGEITVISELGKGTIFTFTIENLETGTNG